MLYSIYAILALVYIWYRYGFVLIEEPQYSPLIKNYLISVVIPTYNEDPKNLELCIRGAIAADGNKEIFIINDGSTDNTTKPLLQKLKKEYPQLIIHNFKKNKGKRKAHEYAFKKAKGEFLITIDSDTLVKKDAFEKLVRPFSNGQVGAVTGNIKLLNRNDNFLTKMISAQYWNAFNFERNSLAYWGIVTCCSGPLSAYRKEYLMPVMGEYANQTFLGKRCTYGDDRALTRLLLQKYSIVFAKDAIAHTYSPNTLKSFIKQQLRWKKSWIRETYLTSKFMCKRSKMLTWEIFITTAMPFLGFFVRTALIVSFIFYPFLMVYYLISILLMAAIRNLWMLIGNTKEFFYVIPYSLVHEGVIFWLYPIALFRLKDTSWGTR